MKTFFILALLCGNALAQDSNGRIKYVVKPEFVSVNLAAEYITRGLILAPETLMPETELKNILNIGDVFKEKAKEYAEQDETTVNLAKDVFKESKSDITVAAPSSTSKTKLPVKLESYFSCLAESTPIFKRMFSLQKQEYLQGDETEELIESISIRLDHDRGLLGQISVDGALCGRYLGTVAFPKVSDLFELKYLTVMGALNVEEKSSVLAALVAIFHPDSPVEDKLMLKKLVEYQLGKIHFEKRNVFSLAEISSDYETLLKEAAVVTQNNGVTVRGTAINNWSNFEKGISWAREKLAL